MYAQPQCVAPRAQQHTRNGMDMSCRLVQDPCITHPQEGRSSSSPCQLPVALQAPSPPGRALSMPLDSSSPSSWASSAMLSGSCSGSMSICGRWAARTEHTCGGQELLRQAIDARAPGLSRGGRQRSSAGGSSAERRGQHASAHLALLAHAPPCALRAGGQRPVGVLAAHLWCRGVQAGGQAGEHSGLQGTRRQAGLMLHG